MNNTINPLNAGIRTEQSKQRGSGAAEELNGIFSALVTKIDAGKASFQTKTGREFAVDTSSLEGGANLKAGDELYFEMLNSDGKSMTLRQIIPERGQAESAKQRKSQNLAQLMLENDFSSAEGNVFVDKSQEERIAEEAKREAAAISRIKRAINQNTANLSAKAVSELIRSGIAFEKIDLSMLNSAASEIVKSAARGGEKPNDGQRERIAAVKTLDEDSALELIKTEKPLTIDNIYRAHKQPNKTHALDGETLEALENEIRKNLEGSDAEEDLAAARKLASREIAVTGGNIAKFKFLTKLGTFNIEKLALHEMKDGKSFSEIELNEEKLELAESYAELEDKLADITPRRVDILLHQKSEVTLYNLSRVSDDARISENTGEEALLQKQRLIEIQLRLNSGNIGRLIAKNVRIDQMPLQAALDEIKAAQSERFEALLVEAGDSMPKQNSEKLGAFYESLRAISGLNELGYKPIIRREIRENIEEIEGAVKAQAILKAYDENLTRVNRKYNDGFSNVKDEFGNLLENLGIAATAENIRAAKILSRNSMDVTEENIAAVRIVDAKLDYVSDRLHPKMAAELSAKGLDLAKMELDGLIAFIDEYNGEFGGGLKDRIAENIAELDRKKELSPEIRQGMIEIYRLLHKAQTNGLASVGAVLKAGKLMTFGNLVEGAKLYSQGKTKGEQPQNTAAFEHNERQIREFTANITGDKLAGLLADENNRGLLLGEINRLLADEDGERTREILEKAEVLRETAPNLLKFMSDNSLVINYHNLEILKSIASGKSSLAKKLNGVAEILDDEPEAAGLLESVAADDGREALEEKIGRLIDIVIGMEDREALPALNEIKAELELKAGLGGRYNIPIKFNGSFSEIEMLVLNHELSEDDAGIYLSLDAGRLGKVSAMLSVEGGKMSARVFCGSKAGLSAMEEEKELFAKLMEQAGFGGCEIYLSGAERDFSLAASIRGGSYA